MLLGHELCIAMLIFYHCLPMFTPVLNVCSLRVSRPVFSTTPTKQDEFVSTHFELVLVKRRLSIPVI